ncbi:MAG: PQQ-binding-like beta-propeller repeat protein, partial [Planctomycetaceae bacterium]
GKMFVGFNDQDKLIAIDTQTGKTLWTAFAEAPIRFAPVAFEGNIFCTSDDGYLYCWSQEDGSLQWRFRGGPSDQKALGNQRFTSAWPARGGPVVRDGNVYFAASIWPFMGTFIYSLDAKTGDVVWVNDSTGSQYIKQPHSAPSFAGVAPQGCMVATEKYLVVPGGRSVPAVFERATGKLLYFEINAGGKGTGGANVFATEKRFFLHTREKGTRAFELATGKKTAFRTNEPVLAGDIGYSASIVKDRKVVQALRLHLKDQPKPKKDKKATAKNQHLIWEVEADGTGDLIQAGTELFAGGTNGIARIGPLGQKPRVTATIPTQFKVERLLAANGKVFVVGLDGTIAAYADHSGEPITQAKPATASDQTAPVDRFIASRLAKGGDAEGFAIWYGMDESRIGAAAEFSRHFKQLAVIEDEPRFVAKFRETLDGQGLYGTVTVHAVKPWQFQAPPYVANMVIVDRNRSEQVATNKAMMAMLFKSVRPYGGVMQLICAQSRHEEFVAGIKAMNLPRAEIRTDGAIILVEKVGRIPDSDDWTHQYGNIANTVKSDDASVKLPLGVLWFGGSSNMDVLPRHGHGPPEQVIGGRLFIQGMNSLSARDVYTGRVLWKRDFEDLGTFDVYYDETYEDTPLNPKYNQVHIPGANGRGTNFVATDDLLYIVEGSTCHAMDPASGKDKFTIELPQKDEANPVDWGYLGIYEDVLIGGVGFANYRKKHQLQFPTDLVLKGNAKGYGSKSFDRAASRALVGFDRKTGKQLWQVEAKHSFWHNGICAGDGKLFCLDKNPHAIEQALKRRGKSAPDTYRIVAFESRTGTQAWEHDYKVFGTWLSYDAETNSLLQAGAKARDRLVAETGQGMAMHNAADGSINWIKSKLKYSGPCILHNGWIITNSNSYAECAGAFRITDGEQKLVANPITGEQQPWKMTRAYGCNNIIACENFLTFRSGAAGFYDLETNSGTGNLGGFKSGCTSNLIVANGVLNAPDYTRTCSCSYQNQTSLALVHMPEIDMWAVNNDVTAEMDENQIDRIAINFGAPGDRRDDDGNLWIEYPKASGNSPPIQIAFTGTAEFQQQHPSTMRNADRPWVHASGVRNITGLTLSMRVEEPLDLKRRGIAITDANDDAEESQNGSVNLTSSDLEFVEDSVDQTIGLRFPSMPIAQGTKINSASIQFAVDEPTDTVTSLRIHVEETTNATAFTTKARNLSARKLSTEFAEWSPPPWTTSGEAKAPQRTTNVGPLLQTLVNRPDWQPGNAVAFIITGKGKRVARSANGKSKPGARLLVDAPQVAVRPQSQDQREAEVELLLSSLRGSGSCRLNVVAQGKPVRQNVLVPESGTASVRFQTRIGSELTVELAPTDGAPVLSGLSLKFIEPTTATSE